MNEDQDRRATVGVRPADPTHGRLRWVKAGDFQLTVGDRVVVAEGGAEWPAEVLIPPDRLLEWVPEAKLPEIRRIADPDQWPPLSHRAGRQLLDSLPLTPGHVSPQ